MESKDEFKKLIKKNRTCQYFYDIMRAWDRDIDIHFNGVLLDKNYIKQKMK